MPVQYNVTIAQDRNICVKGSVEGVKIALIIVLNKIIYFHELIICFTDTIPINPIIICIIGIWNASPVLINKINIKSKYCSNDHKGSTISDP